MEENKENSKIEEVLNAKECLQSGLGDKEEYFYHRKEKDILKLQKIDCLIKALGTMVMIPEYESDPTQIGVKHFKGTIQQPILLNEYRERALKQLDKFINEL